MARARAQTGRVVAALAGDFLGQPLPGSISGTARCDAGALLLPLQSAGGVEGVALRAVGPTAATERR
ncbi:hypothetical protein AB5I41_29255 [Sphingomonas sp. MMS24-JH45]